MGKVEILRAHKENLQKASTFEEYRDAHVAYIEMLILKEQEIKIEWKQFSPEQKES